MPNYDYICPKCGKHEEHNLPINAKATVWCDSCRKPMEKQFNYQGVHFKGTGFHDTDYKPSAHSSIG